MTPTLASFLRPEGFECPSGTAVLREGSVVTEAGRYAIRVLGERRTRMGTPATGRAGFRTSEPVLLVSKMEHQNGVRRLRKTRRAPRRMHPPSASEGFRTAR